MKHKEQTGILEENDLKTIVPGEKRLTRGPVAVIECVQPIPCDPCSVACPQKAVTLEGGCVSGVPKLDVDKCTGCTLCVSKCPGRAIFIVDKSVGNSLCRITIPHEILPTPVVGSDVAALDREGREVATAKVVKVILSSFTDKTAVVTIELAERFCMDVRAIRVVKEPR
jgi:Fe-S-cluster-containing hydrogenase component 2